MSQTHQELFVSDHSASKPSHRPAFPKRAVITGGMPYGNKSLHFGHIGGVFIHADTFARFLRDRIGPENVLFVSGTDCFGSPILEYHRKLVDSGEQTGSLEEFVIHNHENQKNTLASYDINIDFFAASGLAPAAQRHREMSQWVFERLKANGHLERMSTLQFFDTEKNCYLNGRQVEGTCPIAGCQSERAYADECALGHQYMPQELVGPKSTLSDSVPDLRETANWYFKLPDLKDALKTWVEKAAKAPGSRRFVNSIIHEFLEPPVVHVVKKHEEALRDIQSRLPQHEEEHRQKNSITLCFDTLDGRATANALLSTHGIQYRNGKTLVPFRLSGNCPWGVPVPSHDGLDDLTFWVWPESLWAPISFSSTLLAQRGDPEDSWKDWWCSKDAQVYQFIGEDNVYFYGPAEMGMFLGLQGPDVTVDVPDGALQVPELVVNKHLLFLDKKASSSGAVKPPMADELLNHYTTDQLRAHFLSLGLGQKNISFRPKPFNPTAGDKDADPALKEGNMLTNVFNRFVRSCFYTLQKHTDGRIPVGVVSDAIRSDSERTLLAYERSMHKKFFPQAFGGAEKYIRNASKAWNRQTQNLDFDANPELVCQLLIDSFHQLKTAALMMHPFVPAGCERIRLQLNVSEKLWSWSHAFDDLYSIMDSPDSHQPVVLQPREDFFARHPSQF